MRVSARFLAHLLCAAGLSFAFIAPASAASSPAGDWMVAKGEAIIRVVDCGGRYWGLVAWEKNPGGTDAKNPNPALRNRPTLGMPVLLGMRPAGQQGTWSGELYNSEDGRTYGGNITLQGPDTLNVQGCVLGIFCGGEQWRRVNGASALAQAGHARGAGATAALANETPARICSGLVRGHR
jgi:uncharacterized protein (DUF2147 family)